MVTTQRAVYLGGDATNPTLILRINSFLRAGVALTAFTFRRRKFNTEFQPTWRNIAMGYTEDRHYLLRLMKLIQGLIVMVRHKAEFRDAEFVYARNLDLGVLAVMAKKVIGFRAKVIYEVEDIQEVLFKETLAGSVFRFVERWVLRNCDLLVVMSPYFVTGYYEPEQGYAGPWFALENKYQPSPDLKPQPEAVAQRWRTIQDRWVIGWFGTLRCVKSMNILCEIAERLGDRVEIYTRGYPTETGLDAYLEKIRPYPNITYEGEYTMPDDIEALYGRVHFSWCLDFHDEGGNSELLLACRLYQGGYFGAVPVLKAGTAMERFLAPHRFGHAFGEPYAETIAAFLENLTWDAYVAEREHGVAIGEDVFLEDGRDMRALLKAIADLDRPTRTSVVVAPVTSPASLPVPPRSQAARREAGATTGLEDVH